MSYRAGGSPPAQALRLVNAATNKRETLRVPGGGLALVVRETASDPIMQARIDTIAGVLARTIPLLNPDVRSRAVSATDAAQMRGVAVTVWVGPNPPGGNLPDAH